MKKSEVKETVRALIHSATKRQRVSAYRAAWQIKHAATDILNELEKQQANRGGH